MQRRNNLAPKYLWVGLCALLLLSLIGLLSLHQPSGVTGRATVQSIALVQAGKEFFMEVRDIPNLRYMNILFTEMVKGKVLKVEERQGAFEGIALTQFEVIFPEQEKIGWIEFTFKVKKDDLRWKGLKTATLYVNGVGVPTSKIKEEGDYAFFLARTDKLGRFVLGWKALEEKITAPSAGSGQVTEEPEIIPMESSWEAQPPRAADPSVPIEEVPTPLPVNGFQRFLYWLRRLLP